MRPELEEELVEVKLRLCPASACDLGELGHIAEHAVTRSPSYLCTVRPVVVIAVVAVEPTRPAALVAGDLELLPRRVADDRREAAGRNVVPVGSGTGSGCPPPAASGLNSVSQRRQIV